VAEPYHNAFTDALVGNAERMTKANQDAANGIQSAAGKAGDSLSVTYSDIDALATRLKSHSAFVVTKAQAAAKVAVDGDVLESTALSPLTAAIATAAILNAAGQLTTYVVIADAVALVVVGVVATYRAADAALEVASACLIGIGGTSWAATISVVDQTVAEVKMAAGLAYTSVLTYFVVGLAIGAVIQGATHESVRVLVAAVEKASKEADGNPFVFAGIFVGSVGTGWNAEKFWESATLSFETGLGQLGGLYPMVIEGLITSALAWGLLRDGTAIVSATAFNMKTEERRIIAHQEIVSAMKKNLAFGSHRSDPEIQFDSNNNFVPRNVSDLFFSAHQIDFMGDQDEAVIRVIKSIGPDGITRYTVQIPSTKNWSPLAGATPNDSASDIYAFSRGDQTALAQAVYEAMERAGITKRDPVMLAGFSLGGITAAAIASGHHGYNIQQVVTAGAPIGNFDLRNGANPPGAISLEAKGDLVTALDGKPNPSSDRWQTYRGDTARFQYENADDSLGPFESHNALRYALMADRNDELNNDPRVKRFLSGELTVVDQYATRR
jgi:hypothetical protein